MHAERALFCSTVFAFDPIVLHSIRTTVMIQILILFTITQPGFDTLLLIFRTTVDFSHGDWSKFMPSSRKLGCIARNIA